MWLTPPPFQVPREPFELVVRAFAGRVGWDGPGSTIEADDPRITHHVIDRVTVVSLHSVREQASGRCGGPHRSP